MQPAPAAVSFDAVRLRPLPEAKHGLPLLVEPAAWRDAASLAAWIGAHRTWVHDQMRQHGAVLFRGFDLAEPKAFELVARAIDDELKNEYLGTSPRDALTDYVFNASELPPYFPIPEHCEMSFVKDYPRRIFFCCLLPPAEGGETPLVDFRRVWEDMDPGVRQRFSERGIRIVRNYAGPEHKSAFNFFELKPWHDMFRTRDHAAVEAKCAEQGFEATWGADESLRLVSRHAPMKLHPETGEPVWFNHLTTFHLSTASAEYERIYALRPTWRNFGLLQFARAMVAVRQLTTNSDDQSMHCTYLDGSEIEAADIEHVRDLVWRHLVVYAWQLGDVVAIDNHSVGHGRLPYEGPRHICVCWA